MSLPNCSGVISQNVTTVYLFIHPNHPYDILPNGSRNPFTYIDVVMCDGAVIHYDRISEGTGYEDAVYEHSGRTSPFYQSLFRWNGDGWDLRLKDGSLFNFPENYFGNRANQGAPVGMQDAAGRKIRFTRDIDNDLTELTSPSGRFVKFEYDEAYRVARATDDSGRSVEYRYDIGGRLASVSSPGHVSRYQYDGTYLINLLSDGTSRVSVEYVNGQAAASSPSTLTAVSDDT